MTATPPPGGAATLRDALSRLRTGVADTRERDLALVLGALADAAPAIRWAAAQWGHDPLLPGGGALRALAAALVDLAE